MPSKLDDLPQDHTLVGVYPTAFRAVKTGDAETLTNLLSENPDLANARSQQGRTLLNHLCDWPGHFPNEVEIGRVLIDAGADINARAIDPDSGETSLQWAVSSNDVIMAEFLIESGASVNGLDDDLRPLAQALFYGCSEVAASLVRKGATVNLEFAAGLGRDDLIPGFFNSNHHLHPHAGAHTAPINNAITRQQPKEELLEQSLIYAVITDRVEAAKVLLDYGADLKAMPSGFHFIGTPLHWAAGGECLSMAEFLVLHGADIHAEAPDDKATPLDIAKGRRSDAMIRLLRKLGATR
ncbi:MAG TPA: ankyrin repeat domain-containing protein [Bacillales bacterium]|nr:ankyrin repeat domain-containing protein [Bacillales bacterium]